MEPTTVDLAKRSADSYIPHARGCKKPAEDCKQCTRAIAFYAGLPLATLALVLEDRPTLKS